MPEIQTTITPHNQQPYVQRTYPTESELDAVIQSAAEAQKAWSKVPLEERVEIGRKFIEEFKNMANEIPLELTMQMGRPVSQGAGEIRGLVERAEYMLSIASKSLADVALTDTDKPGFRRFIKRTPLGVILIIAPWNFPYLTSINVLLPALLAGNAVLLKPSPQTPLTASRLALALTRAGVPLDVIQVLHMSPKLTEHVVQHPQVSFVSFTGSVGGGRAVARAAVEGPGFMGVGLELGGKDPAYVREDADLGYTVAELVDGAYFNSGQSCCAIERIYVHESLYDEFVQRFVDIVKTYKLGDPTLPSTTLGPVVSLASAARIRKQIADAVAAGAKKLIPEDLFSIAKEGTTYVAPQVLVDVDHSMEIMKAKTFGPVVGIQKVSSDTEALHLMNDSPYGLTASIWTNAHHNPESESAFLGLVDGLETGTVFLNRCDYLDPALAWTGVKDSGRGVSLSRFGYDQLTRAKSVHMKIKTS
ncbi:hypothetical protein Hypma_014768 [Hypsizygus marmoreus]|uniref:Aldehyde dehydrogenase domain-containing protein n=1 Tax=Hypsizygus marmoreus TaxID=39966 RepID=A0A369JBD9_HYPMA|nr:hypothetical protein Hypma_014768 [Hypsizygus marmoreus]